MSSKTKIRKLGTAFRQAKASKPDSWKAAVDSEEKRNAIAVKLCSEIAAAQQSKSALEQRWDENEKIYRNEPPRRTNKPFTNAADLHIPLVQPRIDGLDSKLSTMILGMNPWFKVGSQQPAQGEADVHERCLQFILEQAGFGEHLSVSTKNCARHGLSIWRVKFEARARGYYAGQDYESGIPAGDAQFVGVGFDVIHPKKFVVYPLNGVKAVQQAKFVGHSYYLRVQEIREEIKRGWFIEDEREVRGGDYEQEKEAGRSRQWSRVEESNIIDQADESVEIYHLVCKLDLNGDGFEEYYEIDVAYNDQAILRIEPYHYYRPNYFITRMHIEEGFWPSNSVAQNLQGLQKSLNSMMNMYIDTQYMNAFPPLFAPKGSMPGKIKYGYGEVVEVDGPLPPQPQLGRSDLAEVPFAIQYIEDKADSASRVSRTTSSQQFRPNTTASEVNVVAGDQAVGLSDYALKYAGGLAEIAKFVMALVKVHFEMIQEAHGPEAVFQSEDEINERMTYRLAAIGPDISKQQQFMAAMQIAQLMMPDPETGIDHYELAQRAIAASGLAEPTTIQKPKEQTQMEIQQMQEQQMQMQQQQMEAEQQAQQQQAEMKQQELQMKLQIEREKGDREDARTASQEKNNGPTSADLAGLIPLGGLGRRS